jgi:hypothetical protein
MVAQPPHLLGTNHVGDGGRPVNRPGAADDVGDPADRQQCNVAIKLAHGFRLDRCGERVEAADHRRQPLLQAARAAKAFAQPHVYAFIETGRKAGHVDVGSRLIHQRRPVHRGCRALGGTGHGDFTTSAGSS